MEKRVRFGRYELIRQIGMGGMADLYLAEMSGPYGFNKRVAIKKIRPDLNRHTRFREMFLHESKIMAALGHRNLVQVLELGEVEGVLYMCLEYVPGCDLAEVIDRLVRSGQAMDPALAAWVAREICQGLKYVHELKDTDGKPLKVIHRDINPSNILISRDGDVKLGDFGIAKSMGRLVRTVQGQLLGKLGYHSPEQVRGEDLALTSDLYSVGLILYELLSLQRFIRGRSEREILSNTARPTWRPFEPERQVPKELESIVTRAVRLKPEDRYTSAESFSRALDQFLEQTNRTVGSQEMARLVVPSESISTSEPETDQDTLPELELPVGIPLGGQTPKTETVALEAEPEGPRSRVWLWLAIPLVLIAGGLGIYLATRPTEPADPASDSNQPVDVAPAVEEPHKPVVKKRRLKRRRKPTRRNTPAKAGQDQLDPKELRQEYQKLLARLKERGVLPRDSLAVDRLSARAGRLIGKPDHQAADKTLEQLAKAVDELRIDHQFIERKMARLNRVLDRTGLQSAFTDQIRGVLNHTVANRFEEANTAINKIFGEIKRRRRKRGGR